MDSVYLDFNATTPVEPEVLDAMLPYFSNEFGNAASIHTFGQKGRAAVETARELGADMRGHASRPLTANLVAQADYLIAMTQSHLLALAAQFRGIGPRPRLLSSQGEDLPDPIGCEQQVYQECARRILRDLQGLLPEFEQ